MTADRLRKPLLVLLALWVAAVAYLTLTPEALTPPLTWRGFFCVACAWRDTADIILNWAFFIPGGMLAAVVFGPRRGLAVPVGLSVLVETLQIGVPGRDPAFQDLLFNSVGGLTGVLLMRRGLAPWARHVLSVAAIVAWLGPLALLIPRTTSADLYGQWTPRFGGMAHYDGDIVEASVGGLAVESRRYPDKPRLDSAVVERRPVVLMLRAAPPPPSLAPIFQIMDSGQQTVFELHALGPDLIVRGHNLARILRLDQPDVRWPGAMEGVAPGDTATVVVDRGRDSVCMSVDEPERCRLAPSLADGWGFLLNLEGPPLWFRRLLSVGWALGLGGLLGLVVASRRGVLIGAVGLAALGYVGALLSPDVSPSLLDAGLLLPGTLIGTALQRPVVRLWRKLRPS